MGTRGGFFGRRNVEAATDTVPFVNGFRMAFNANMNQEIIRAKSIIAELKLNNETAHQLTHTIGNLLTVQRLLLEQIHGTSRRTLERQASVPASTRRITNELDNLAIEVQNMKRLKRW